VHGDCIQHRPSSLDNINIALNFSGDTVYSTSDGTWEIKLSPNFTLTSPKLLAGTGLQVLRADDGETGFFFEEELIRHFFVFFKPPTANRFILKFEVLPQFINIRYFGSYTLFSSNWEDQLRWSFLMKGLLQSLMTKNYCLCILHQLPRFQAIRHLTFLSTGIGTQAHSM
jgi:hypothetical protein